MIKRDVIDIQREFGNAGLPDLRLDRRLVVIAEQVAADPSASFPQVSRSDADLEGLYRFMNNSRVTLEGILEPHRCATRERAAGAKDVTVAHDTTEFTFEGEVAETLGFLGGQRRGFLGHFALALGDGGAALGVAGLRTYFREERPKKRRKRLTGVDYAKIESVEGGRWGAMVNEVEEWLQRSVVHVMDREADRYALLAQMAAAGHRFVVRMRQQWDRPAATTPDGEWECMADVINTARYVTHRYVPLSKRVVDSALRNTHKSREQREATLVIEASTLTLRRPRWAKPTLPETIDLNLVRVHEIEQPDREQPVEWWLVTTESIGSAQEVEAIVDRYRMRWKIEEYFKALKTGCAFEKRNLESRDALLRALGVLAPLAWNLLAIRDAGRLTPSAPASLVFSRICLQILRTITKRPFDDEPTIEQAIYALAEQGGHLKRNGPPGWQTLGHGLEALWWAELGFLAGVQHATAEAG